MKYLKNHYIENSIYFVLIFSFLFIVSPLNNAYSQLNHAVAFDRNELRIKSEIAKDGNSYDRIGMSSLYRSFDAGMPDLLVRYMLIQ